ncbi:uncharacterized protein CANTADRAFT_131180 [Suhomyces tanzawaensis NRRL Y-17324]|uniref:Uncharacterized protein n=1 Tax=Suhomyces tanzawaensis NRRL Y-17324 TaxID=984487 RepID=A0A1E4SR45_9ASCO|nr:uncharacterized protein CANTADRAFT_131180 [Suhomyces tanzawaensis NRRL Y-17324]ODV81980.1 hypothetical protein CANTADRAFT_131180 [Suhomyces tanzawaensis NRRL Y-17324]
MIFPMRDTNECLDNPRLQHATSYLEHRRHTKAGSVLTMGPDNRNKCSRWSGTSEMGHIIGARPLHHTPLPPFFCTTIATLDYALVLTKLALLLQPR